MCRGDAAYCQVTLDTCFYFIFVHLTLTAIVDGRGSRRTRPIRRHPREDPREKTGPVEFKLHRFCMDYKLEDYEAKRANHGLKADLNLKLKISKSHVFI